jgi:hypothetical protein
MRVLPTRATRRPSGRRWSLRSSRQPAAARRSRSIHASSHSGRYRTTSATARRREPAHRRARSARCAASASMFGVVRRG